MPASARETPLGVKSGGISHRPIFDTMPSGNSIRAFC